jgi:hypothetical protein
MTRHRLVTAAAIVGGTAMVGWAPTRPFYLTNDDVAMRLLVEGGFAPHAVPTAFVMFMHVAVGWLLKTLYAAMASVPWYDLMMLVTAVSASAALVAVWIRSSTGLWLVRPLLLSVAFLAPLFATPQFSLVGMTCAAAGLTLLTRALALPHRDPGLRGRLLFGVCLFGWGTLIRWEGAALLLGQATASSIAAGLVGLDSGSRRTFKILGAAAIASLLPIGAAITHNAAYQRSPGWQSFPEFNYTRGMLTEYAPGEVSPELLSTLRETTGWSGNDLRLLRGWFFEDRAVFSLDKLRAALAVLRHDQDRSAASMVRSAAVAARVILSETWAALLILVALAASSVRPVRQLSLTLVLLVVFFAVSSAVSVALKELPFRVYWPMLVLVAGLAVDAAATGRPRALPLMCLVAAGALVSLLTIPRWHQQQRREIEAREVAADLVGLDRLAPSLVVIHADALRWEYVWRPFRPSYFPRPFLGIGASAQTPPVQAALIREGRGGLVSALCSTDRVVLLARPWLPPALVIFMKEHYGRDIAFDAVFEGRTFTAWQCRSESTPKGSP